MCSRISVLLFLAVAIHSASAGIDFTPTLKEYSSEGFTYRQVILKNDEGKATLIPPQKWLIRGAKDRLQLTPPDKNFVEAIIQATPLASAAQFDEAGLKALEQQVTRELPAGAQAIQVLKRLENSVAIGPPSFEFVMSYQALGYTFQRSVIFVNFPDQQLVFRFTASKADFEKFASDFRRSISSWQWIEPDATVAATANR